jgi:hypothetical protein
MLNLKVARECDQPLQEVDDLLQSTFGLESYVERVETLVTSEGSDAAPQYVGVWGMGGVGNILEYDGGTPPAKQLYLHGAGQNLEEFPQEWKAEVGSTYFSSRYMIKFVVHNRCYELASSKFLGFLILMY